MSKLLIYVYTAYGMLLYNTAVTIFIFIYMYFVVYRGTVSVTCRCNDIMVDRILFITVYIPVVEYTVNNTVYATKNAFNPTFNKNKFKVGSEYKIRYKRNNNSIAYYYSITAFTMLVILCLISSCLACLIIM